MLTTQCRFHVYHDGEMYQVVYTVSQGKTAIFLSSLSLLQKQMVFEMQFICEDRKAAELIVKLYTNQKNTNAGK